MNQTTIKIIAKRYARLAGIENQAKEVFMSTLGTEERLDLAMASSRKVGYEQALADAGILQNEKFNQYLQKEIDYYQKFPESL